MPSKRKDDKVACRVCGLLYDPTPSGRLPQDVICFCCGTHIGYSDGYLKGVRAQRKQWLASKAQWNRPSLQPDDWGLFTLDEQLKNIPPEWW